MMEEFGKNCSPKRTRGGGQKKIEYVVKFRHEVEVSRLLRFLLKMSCPAETAVLELALERRTANVERIAMGDACLVERSVGERRYTEPVS